MTSRNIHAALAACAAALADAPQTAMGLRSALAQCRLRNHAALRDFNDAEARELFEAALSHEPLRAGAVGEAALAYLVAARQLSESAALHSAFDALHSFGADDDAFKALRDWFRESGERAMAQADALEAYAAQKAASDPSWRHA